MRIEFILILSFLSSPVLASKRDLPEEKKSVELIPQHVVSSLLSRYNEAETKLINADLELIRLLAFRDKQAVSGGKNPSYIGTAGGPLSRKSTILEKVLEEKPIYNNYVYLDPDQRGLKFMANTYIARSLSNLEIFKAQSLLDVRRNAYLHWRDASNYITNTLINEAYDKKFNIAHGTTLTGAVSTFFLKKLKERGYEITLLLSFASDSFRKEALEFRNDKQGFYQSTPSDFIEKANLFSERMKDYFEFADHIDLYWTEKMGDPIKIAASWNRGKKIKIEDKMSYGKIVNYYTKYQVANPELQKWEALLQTSEKK